MSVNSIKGNGMHEYKQIRKKLYHRKKFPLQARKLMEKALKNGQTFSLSERRIINQ